MTGVIKSNRCGTCRKRKIKCDETLPMCGPCRKGNRECEAAVSKFKFASVRLASISQAHKPAEPSDDLAVARATAADRVGSFKMLRFRQTKKFTAGKDRDEPVGKPLLMRSPSQSPSETVQRGLLESLYNYNDGLNLTNIHKFLSEIPPLIGQSAALDDAVACLIYRHSSTCRNQHRGLDPNQAKLYGKALCSLRTAIEKPVECDVINILAAIHILVIVEQIGGGTQGREPNFIEHAEGATRVTEILGPGRFKSKFAKKLFMASRSASITTSFAKNWKNPLNTLDWQTLDYSDVFESECETLNDHMARELIRVPGLIHRSREIWSSPDSKEGLDILREARHLRRSLEDVSAFVERKATNGIDVIELPSAYGDSLTPVVYQFATRDLARICVAHWTWAIAFDSLTANFLPPTSSPAVLQNLYEQIRRNRRRLYMSYEYSEQFWPLGSQYMVPPLVVAWLKAPTEERAWIMARLWKLDVCSSQEKWTPDTVENMSKFIVGEPIPKRFGDTQGRAFLSSLNRLRQYALMR